jgi:hypothetical protein
MGTLTKRSEIEKEITEAFGQVPTFVKQLPDGALPGFWALLGGYQMGETAIPNWIAARVRARSAREGARPWAP